MTKDEVNMGLLALGISAAVANFGIAIFFTDWTSSKGWILLSAFMAIFYAVILSVFYIELKERNTQSKGLKENLEIEKEEERRTAAKKQWNIDQAKLREYGVEIDLEIMRSYNG